MAETDLGPKSDKVKKALQWVSEVVKSSPEMERRAIIEKALLRFNLSPRECEFLNKNFLTDRY